MTLFEKRICCPAKDDAPDRRSFYRPVGAPVEIEPGNAVGRVIAPPMAVDPPRDWRNAVHEAAHAVAGWAVGRRTQAATVGPRLCVLYVQDATRDRANAFCALAGPVAEGMIAYRRRHRRSDQEWLIDIDRVRSGRAGMCDGCTAARSMIAAEIEDAATIAELRRLEGIAIGLFDLPQVSRCVRRIADELMKHGTLFQHELEPLLYDEIGFACLEQIVENSKTVKEYTNEAE